MYVDLTPKFNANVAAIEASAAANIFR